jgi:hypothetical protein
LFRIREGGGPGFGGEGIAVFLEVEGFPGDAGDGGEEAGVDEGIEVGVADGEIGEEFDEAEASEVEGQFLEFFGGGGLGEVEGEIEFGGEHLEVFLVLFPVLESTGVPGGEVLFGDFGGEWGINGLVEALDDLAIGEAVGEELVDEVAEFFGEAGDFAVAASAVGGVRGDWFGSEHNF